MEQEEVLGFMDAAQFIGVHYNTMRKYCDAVLPPDYVVGKNRLWKKSTLQRWLDTPGERELTLANIAKRYGITTLTVRRAMYKRGVKPIGKKFDGHYYAQVSIDWLARAEGWTLVPVVVNSSSMVNGTP